MLALFYIVLIILFVFNPGGKGKSFVSKLFRDGVKATVILFGIIIILHFLLQAGILK